MQTKPTQNNLFRILMVCHGNICRSPMAELIMKQLLRESENTAQIIVESAAVSREEIGNDLYPPAKGTLRSHHIPIEPHAARQMEKADYDRFDLLLGMDDMNIRGMKRICNGDPGGKIRLLLSFTKDKGDIADPWYTDDFETTYRQIVAGCKGLLAALSKA